MASNTSLHRGHPNFKIIIHPSSSNEEYSSIDLISVWPVVHVIFVLDGPMENIVILILYLVKKQIEHFPVLK